MASREATTKEKNSMTKKVLLAYLYGDPVYLWKSGRIYRAVVITNADNMYEVLQLQKELTE